MKSSFQFFDRFPQLLVPIGNVYIADRNNYRIRKVTVSTDLMCTIAGSGGTGSYSGDGGQATLATFKFPRGISIDSVGNVYIADTDNNRIRKVVVDTNVPRFCYYLLT